jgi:hypothetical protein
MFEFCMKTMTQYAAALVSADLALGTAILTSMAVLAFGVFHFQEA